MRIETNTRIPSQDKARATIDRARQLRAETLGRMLSAAWALLARQRLGAPVGAMTHAGP